MAEKAKRPRKKRSAFEEAFAMTLRTTFAQLEEPADSPVSSDTPISEAPVATSRAVTTKDSVENKQAKCAGEVRTRSAQTKCTDEVSTRSEHTKCTDEVSTRSKHTKCTDEVRTTSEAPTTLQEPVDPPVSSDTPASVTPIAMSHVVLVEENEQTKCADEVRRRSAQTKCTDEVNTRSEHTKCANEARRRSEHTKCADEVNTRSEHTKCADEVNTRSEHTKCADEVHTRNEHTDTLPKIRFQKSLIASRAEQTLVSYLHANGNHVSSYALISQETGITVGTLRRCFKKFIEYGLISTSKYCGRGKMQGIIITICNLQAAIDNVQIMHRSSAKQLALYGNIPVAATEQKFELAPSPILPTKKELEKQPLAQTTQESTPIVNWLQHLNDTDVANFWPALSAVHFGTKQIRQALATLQAQGKVFDQQFGEDFKQGLDHAEFALGNAGGIKDRHGRTVSKPCSYIYSSLAKDGYYAAPENYISPEAQRANDEAIRLAKERAASESLQKEIAQKVTSTVDQELMTLLEQGEANPLYCQLRDALPAIARQGEENRSAHFKRAMNLALKEYMQNNTAF